MNQYVKFEVNLIHSLHQICWNGKYTTGIDKWMDGWMDVER